MSLPSPAPSPLPRRTVLLGAVAIVGASAATGQPLDTKAANDPRVLRLEAIIAELKAAISAELSLEGQPGHEAVIAKAEALERDLQSAADEIFAEPAQTLTDLALRARLVEYWNDRHADFLTDQDRSAAELVRAVLAMSGLLPHEATCTVVSTIPALINALGGRYKVAKQCGITVAEVVRWERDDFVPTGWEYRFACRARKRGYTLAPDFFGRDEAIS